MCPKEYSVSEETLDYKTYKQIKQMMLNFEIVPGQRIVITELADKLEISRTPVKMAMIMLMKEGFVDYSHRQSCYTVHQLTQEEYDGLADFRELLEVGAVNKAIKNMTPAKLEELELKARKFRDAAEANDKELRVVLDLEFHSCIVELAGSRNLSETFRDVYQRFFMQRRITRLLGDRFDQVLAEHDEIVEAFRQGDAERARLAIVNHARLAKDFIDSIYY